MDIFRILWRSVAVLISTLLHYSLILPAYVLVPFGFDPRGVASFLRHRWGLSICRILNIQVTVHGKIPRPPFFLVSNHLSYADVWVLFSVLRGTFIAKSDVKKWPVIGWIIATSGILFVDRSRRMDVKRVNEEISRSITDSQGVILFPEGTTSPGDDVLPFRSPLLHYPAQKQMPVHTVAIHYTSKDVHFTAREYICWWDDTPFAHHVLRMMRLKGSVADLYFGEEPVSDSDRKTLTAKVESQIRSSYMQGLPSDDQGISVTG